MRQNRRQFLKTAIASGIASRTGLLFLTDNAKAARTPGNPKSFKRIAVEEAFSTPEINKAVGAFMGTPEGERTGYENISGFYSEHGKTAGPLLLDMGEGRIAAMDACSVHKMILSLTSNGVQSMAADLATGLVTDANDQLYSAVKKYPDRFDGFVAIAPQAPETAAKELERGISKLGMKGVIINSHAAGEFLDARKFRVIFEAAEALNAPVYLHPAVPPPQMNRAYMDYGLIGAMLGFSAEAGLHALRLILSGLFDDFPRLKMVLGHLGEGIPYYLQRIDTHFEFVSSQMNKKPRRLPSEYFKENFWVSTSGMNGTPAVKFCLDVLGIDRILFAADYPHEVLSLEVEKMDSEQLSEADMNKIYHENAERLFKL